MLINIGLKLERFGSKTQKTAELLALNPQLQLAGF